MVGLWRVRTTGVQRELGIQVAVQAMAESFGEVVAMVTIVTVVISALCLNQYPNNGNPRTPAVTVVCDLVARFRLPCDGPA